MSLANSLQSLKSSKQWKFLNDKTKAAFATLDDTKTAVIKSVNHDIRPPKEKHVQSKKKYFKKLRITLFVPSSER
jgi:hypothetical protein